MNSDGSATSALTSVSILSAIYDNHMNRLLIGDWAEQWGAKLAVKEPAPLFCSPCCFLGKWITTTMWIWKKSIKCSYNTPFPIHMKIYYMPERARWSYLARSRLPALSRKKNFPESYIINPLLTKLVRSRWLDISRVLFLRVYRPRLRLGP